MTVSNVRLKTAPRDLRVDETGELEKMSKKSDMTKS
ncbi:predicted protein [Sclerotinia sclerotiorum 1980 UF-70]|uniref:Uncharacterized protein n=1 Tax=Sclerotinia sclerotiorum (strain ATCC 18683 / 1980 / Ss-1) TaxID=665079 RepID=A7ES03_SCLS1|nr:predicted protein [Sclerotinia sclerotiorum 1980 UF-70]EDN92245.1 predicted protein [Sclerotinia sclerotiorum 1980 UF-70]